MVAQFFIRPLAMLYDTDVRLIALLLLKSGKNFFSVTDIINLAEAEGVRVTHARMLEICLELFINNILMWYGGHYHIANDGLPLYAGKLGYLDRALNDARRTFQSGG
jgi:hypothetical protein